MYMLFLTSFLFLGLAAKYYWNLYVFNRHLTRVQKIANSKPFTGIIIQTDNNQEYIPFDKLNINQSNQYILNVYVKAAMMHNLNQNIETLRIVFDLDEQIYELIINVKKYLQLNSFNDIINIDSKNLYKNDIIGSWESKGEKLNDITSKVEMYAGPNMDFFRNIPGSLNKYIKFWKNVNPPIHILDSNGNMQNYNEEHEFTLS